MSELRFSARTPGTVDIDVLNGALGGEDVNAPCTRLQLAGDVLSILLPDGELAPVTLDEDAPLRVRLIAALRELEDVLAGTRDALETVYTDADVDMAVELLGDPGSALATLRAAGTAPRKRDDGRVLLGLVPEDDAAAAVLEDTGGRVTLPRTGAPCAVLNTGEHLQSVELTQGEQLHVFELVPHRHDAAGAP